MGVDNGVFLTDGVAADDSGALHIWVEAQSVKDDIGLFFAPVDSSLPELDSEDFTSVWEVAKWLRRAAAERAVANYPTVTDLARLVEDRLSGEDGFWEVIEQCGRGGKWFMARHNGSRVPGLYTMDDAVSVESCCADLWIWKAANAEDLDPLPCGGFRSEAEAADEIAQMMLNAAE
ncbi:hypothetical protein [Bifidobacterium cuniculi]|uniref:hypothetical protein n=1 Tax=Bifidobacterium cuniculi TaxID=1688 RepID=UPI001269A2CC|nr:hypothetical protein [Bifidobacterium cuniculi]